jgi:uncharacterized membrane protein
MQSKKGAIEMSMTTIIVIVLGVTLLILGLVFVRGLFEKTNIMSENVFLIAEKELQDRMSASDKIYIPGLEFNIDPGSSATISVGVQNFKEPGEGADKKSKFKVTAKEVDTKELTITNPPELSFGAGEKKVFSIKFKLPKGAAPGTTYSAIIKVQRDGKDYDEQSILISVKES